MDELDRCWHTCRRFYKKFQSACLSGNSTQARKCEYRLVRSHACRIVFYILASKADRTYGDFKRKSLLAIKKEAKHVNPRRFSGKKVHIFQIEKPNGGKRSTVRFDQVSTANQILVQTIMEARHPRSPYEFARQGRGKEAATQHILNNIAEGDKSHVAIADIENAFESITPNTVLDLKLIPASMIRNTVFVPVPALHTSTSKTLASAVCNGIPQGSRCSNFILEKVIETFFSGLGATVACNYSDDILILEKDKATASAILDTLVHRMSMHASGPLTLKPKSVARVGDQMNFCGYWYRWRKRNYGGGPRVTPSNESIRRFYRRLARQFILTSQDMSVFVMEHYPKVDKARANLWSEKKTYFDFRTLRKIADNLADACIPENVLVLFDK